MRTPSCEIMTLDEEHDERKEFVVTIDDTKQIARIPLCKDLWIVHTLSASCTVHLVAGKFDIRAEARKGIAGRRDE